MRPRVRGGCDLAFGLLAGGLALDADQELLVEHRQDASEHRDRGDVLAAFQLGDERMRGAGAPGDLLLGQVQLVAPLTDMGGDPVLLARARIAAYSSRAARYSGLRRARLLVPWAAVLPWGLTSLSPSVTVTSLFILIRES